MNYQKCGCREGGHFGTCELRKAPSPVRLLAEKITQYFLPEPQLGIAVNIAYVESLIQAEISTLEFGHAAEIAGMKNVLSLRIAEAKRETDIRSRTSGYYNGKEKGRSEGYQSGRIQAFEEAAKIAEDAIQYSDCKDDAHHPAWCSLCENGQDAGDFIAAKLRAKASECPMGMKCLDGMPTCPTCKKATS